MNEKYITQKINDVIDYIICKNNPCGLKPPCTLLIQINQVQTPMRKRKLNLWQSTYLDMMRLFCKENHLQTLVLHLQIQMPFLYCKGKPMPYLNGEVKKR